MTPPSPFSQAPSVAPSPATPSGALTIGSSSVGDDPRDAIRSVDNALQMLPATPDMEKARAELLVQKELLKKKIIQTRPLGSQLDSCKGALQRAEKRRAECVAQLEAAQN
eukprot:6304707-Alexandrium_andersonii.AAC.1